MNIFIKNMMNKIHALFARMWVSSKTETIKKQRNPIKQKTREHFGAHYYLGDLLDQLENSFKSLNSLKKVNRTAYKMFSKVSCHVTSKDFLWQIGNHYSITRDQIPSIGCAFFTDTRDGRVTKTDKDGDWVHPTFGYFQKIKNPINVQPSNGTVLEVCFVYEYKEGPVATSYYVSVDDDMNIRPLKELHVNYVNIKPKISRKNNRPFQIPRASWAISSSLIRNHSEQEKDNRTPEQRAEENTWMIINSALAVDTGVNVRVAKGSKRVTFGIDMTRTPYFFKDRDKTVNENGKTQKIFHIVSGHKRTMANGDEIMIKTHFRGIRKFMWNGFQINIVLNGKHAKSLNAYTADATEISENEVIPDGYISSADIGEKIGTIYDNA